MSLLIFHKLLAIFCTVALGWAAGRMRWLGEPAGGLDPARLLGNAAFYIFVPALLFRATARMDLATMPWSALGAYFGPAVLGGHEPSDYSSVRTWRPASALPHSLQCGPLPPPSAIRPRWACRWWRRCSARPGWASMWR